MNNNYNTNKSNLTMINKLKLINLKNNMTNYKAPAAFTFKPSPEERKRIELVANEVGLKTTSEVIRVIIKKAAQTASAISNQNAGGQSNGDV